MRRRLAILLLCALPLAAAKAQTPPTVRLAPDDAPLDIEITAQRLDAARQGIQGSLGATHYDFSPAALSALPGGDEAALNQVLLHAPGVAQDSFGQVHVRGDHANLQYRLDGVQLPEGLSVFGQALETRFAHSISLITGALPAQYGFRLAGVVDIQTKTGLTDPGSEIGFSAGSRGLLQPSASTGGHSGIYDWFLTGDLLRTGIGIENPAGSANALHDQSNQGHGLAHLTATIDPTLRVSLTAGISVTDFQIPNNPGQTPGLGLNVNGVTTASSATLNERQAERTQFAIASVQKQFDAVDLTVSAFTRNSTLAYSPDPLGDLLFNGISQNAARAVTSSGVQSDAAWHAGADHTIRFGVLAELEHTSASTAAQVLPVDANGNQTSTVPITILDNSSKTGGLYGLYLQDEWRLRPDLTLNFGLRFDAVNEYTSESQLSPRVNLVWKARPDTTLHAGYMRTFTPPPFELVSGNTIAKFANTTAAPEVALDTPVRAERAHYFDLGISHSPAPGLTIGLDAYEKLAHNLIDEGQFGAPIILTAFNYDRGEVHGAEFSASYDRGPLSLYGNLAWSRAIGKNITSSQFNFGAAELAYIAGHAIYLDHDQSLSASAGVAYTFGEGSAAPLRLAADALFGSGLRSSASSVPNGRALPSYGTVNLSLTQRFDVIPGRPTTLRLDVLNVTDAVYEIRDGTGVGVGAPQFGLRRTVIGSVSQRF